jgi:hypothetical protein
MGEKVEIIQLIEEYTSLCFFLNLTSAAEADGTSGAE